VFRSDDRLPGNYQLVNILDGKSRISTEKSASVYECSRFHLDEKTGYSDKCLRSAQLSG
jgi:hypothetical protein